MATNSKPSVDPNANQGVDSKPLEVRSIKDFWKNLEKERKEAYEVNTI
jgi:hypothetical protein